MALFPDPFETLPGLQQALDTFRTSGWLQPGLSGGGTYPPINVFRKGDDFIIILDANAVFSSDELALVALVALAAVGSSTGPITSSGRSLSVSWSPSPMASARSITLRSSRTLPGQR